MFPLLTSIDATVIFDGGDENAEDVVEGSLSLVDDLLCGSTKDDGAGLALGAATELDHLLLSDHDLLDELA